MFHAGMNLISLSKILSLLVPMEMLQRSSVFLASSIFPISKLPQGV